MNKYEFEYTIDQDIWYYTFRISAVNKLAAYEDFIEFLKENDIDLATVEVLNCWVNEEDEEDDV